MLQINGKTFMNLQEAVQWLLDNNALPFQCSANYIANTEIGLGTIVNPSPAKVRIGSLIFFADSKVSTVTGLTENGFIVSDQYNDLVDDVVYVSNVALDASGHLIVTLSNGDTIDAGLVKQVSSFSINGSQHLIVNYNDGTSTDLGAIFSGNVNISGNLTADSIIENMSGYSFIKGTLPTGVTITLDYAGVCKNGNKITFVVAGVFNKTSAFTGNQIDDLFGFVIPASIGAQLYPHTLGGVQVLSAQVLPFFADRTTKTDIHVFGRKYSGTFFTTLLQKLDTLSDNTDYYFRIENTFLLSENLAS